MGTKIEAKIVRITPAAAKRLLEKNDNRKLRKAVVERLAIAMANGEWAENGETVKIASNGDVIDGQHRLWAIVKSGATLNILVVSGIERGAYDTIDEGVKRNYSDTLYRRGEVNYALLASTVRTITMIRSGSLRKAGISRTRMDITLKRNRKIRESVEFVTSRPRTRIISPSWSAALHYIMVKIDVEMSADFWHKVITGELIKRGDPEFAARSALTRLGTGIGRHVPMYHKGNICIICWNSKRQGRQVKHIAYKTIASKVLDIK